MTDEDRDNILGHISDIATFHASMYKCHVDFDHGVGNKKVYNDPSLEKFVIKSISRVANYIKGGFGLAGEDFWNFADARPSAYFIVGASLPGACKDL